MEFHERLGLACQSKRVTRRSILEALNESGVPSLATSKATINRWFLGQSEPSLSQGAFLAELLGVTLESLLRDTGDAIHGVSCTPGGLNQDERHVLYLCRRLGFDRAVDRLCLASRERSESD